METTAYTVDHAAYSHKLKAYDKAEKLVKKSDKANVDALHEKFKKDHPDVNSNFLSSGSRNRQSRKNILPQKPEKTRQEALLLQQREPEKLQKVQSPSQKS